MANSEERDITRQSSDIINQIAIIIKNSQIHDPNNAVVLSAIERCGTAINSLLDAHGTVTLDLLGEFFYADGTRIRYTTDYLLNYDFLVREFKRRDLGRLILQDTVAQDDLRTFVKAFIASSFSHDPFTTLSTAMASVASLAVGPLRKVREDTVTDIRKIVKKTYFNAVSYARGMTNKIRSGERIGLRRAKRVVESMVELILEQEELLVGMTAIRDYDEYTYHHSVNVSILSVGLGHRLGLGRRALTEVGLVALFHDVGKIEVPSEILNKPTNFDEKEWKIIRRHPLLGAKLILKLRGFDALSARVATVAFEHHLNTDSSGYPEVNELFKLDFYSRIVSIADQYDAMTSARVYSRVPMAPDKALGVMMQKAGSELDPLLFKFFVNMIGVYPVGALVLLDTKEMGIVHGSNPIFPDRPRVLILIDSMGNRVEGHSVDLSEKDDEGRYLRSIVKTMDPNRYHINLADFFLTDKTSSEKAFN